MAGKKYTLEKQTAKFWSRVDKSGGDDACWLWTGAKRETGYGQVRWKGRSARKAHRVAFEISYGFPPPSNLFVCHTCDNPLCVNPLHLFLGTHKENMEDMRAKGKGAKKLTSVQVTEIRRLFDSHEIERTALARQFGVSTQTVYLIGHRVRWSHISEPPP
jgi:hypothetical protein